MRKKRIYSGTLHDLFLLLTVMLDFEKTQDVVQSACFHFTDIDEHFIFKVSMYVIVVFLHMTQSQKDLNFILKQIRKGVAELIKTTAKDSLNEELDLEVTTTNKIWRQLMAKDKNGATSALKGELNCKPGVLKLQSFMNYFDTS